MFEVAVTVFDYLRMFGPKMVLLGQKKTLFGHSCGPPVPISGGFTWFQQTPPGYVLPCSTHFQPSVTNLKLLELHMAQYCIWALKQVFFWGTLYDVSKVLYSAHILEKQFNLFSEKSWLYVHSVLIARYFRVINTAIVGILSYSKSSYWPLLPTLPSSSSSSSW